MRRHSTGFTLIELLVVVAVIGVLTAIALPLYQDYANGALMTKANYNYEQAVRAARSYTLRQAALQATGGSPPLPGTPDEWIDAIDVRDGVAPGGGPAYTPSETGDAVTGAIGVSTTDPAYEVAFIRPAYLSLTPYRADVRQGDVTYTAL